MSLTLDELLAEVASAPSVTPADQDPRLGKQVGPYKIKERLGRGGMGTVYLAQDTRLERDVALKMLHDESPLACRELLREARRAATVSHASIAQVFDVNEESPPYIAMELVAGDSLHERIAKSPPGPKESLRILSDATEAIAALHAQGIVHRDLTPRNIALTEDGSLKILDFGIAMPLANDIAAESESILRAGTERYVAPERAEGRPPSVKEDVFSIGVLAKDLFGNTPPRAVAGLLERCRSANEAERPADLAEVAKKLREAHAAPRRKRSLWVVAPLIITVALWLAGSLEEEVYEEATPEETRSEAAAAVTVEPTRLTFYAEDQSIHSMSGHGDTFFVTDTLGVSRFNGDNEGVRLSLPEGFHATSAHQVNSGTLVLGLSDGERDAYLSAANRWTRVPLPSRASRLSVAHDGRQVAIIEADGFRITTLESERPTLLESGTDVRFREDAGFIAQSVSWSPDDQRVMFMTSVTDGGRLKELDVATGHIRTLFDSAHLVGRLGTYAFTYVDNDTIAFSIDKPDEAGVGIYVLSTAGTHEPRLVARVPTSIQDLMWCPARNSFRFVAYDPDHKIYRRPLSGGDPQRMTYSDHQDWVTGFSSDGEDIHFSRMTRDGSHAFSVPRSSPSSEVPIVLDSNERPSRAQRRGHDEWIAFIPRERGLHELLHITGASTRSLARLEATPDRWRHAPPFGTQVREGGGRLFFGTRTRTSLRVSAVQGTELRQHFNVKDANNLSWFVFAVSPDGERFAYRDPTGIALTNADGDVLQRISRSTSEVLQSAGFLRDGSLVITAASIHGFTLFHLNVETGETQTLESSYHRWFGSVATSPTRDEFAYTSVGWETDVYEVAPSL